MGRSAPRTMKRLPGLARGRRGERWSGAGQELEYAIVGIGVNVRPASVPAQAAYPATCVEEVVGRSIDRDGLLVGILDGVGRWYPRLGSEALLEAWEGRPGFRGQEAALGGGG